MELRCANHSEVETRVSCNKCGKMICFRCMVPTPVGFRCRDCAKVRPNPLTQVPAEAYAKVTGAAALGALAGAFAWCFAKSTDLFGFFSVIIALGIGYALGALVSHASNRKQATSMGVIAGVATGAAYVFGNVLGIIFRFDTPTSFAFEHALDFRPWDALWSWLSMILSIAMAYTRARQ